VITEVELFRQTSVKQTWDDNILLTRIEQNLPRRSNAS